MLPSVQTLQSDRVELINVTKELCLPASLPKQLPNTNVTSCSSHASWCLSRKALVFCAGTRYAKCSPLKHLLRPFCSLKGGMIKHQPNTEITENIWGERSLLLLLLFLFCSSSGSSSVLSSLSHSNQGCYISTCKLQEERLNEVWLSGG